MMKTETNSQVAMEVRELSLDEIAGVAGGTYHWGRTAAIGLAAAITSPGTALGVAIGIGVQGNRVKESRGEEADEKLVVPGGDFAPEADGILGLGSSNEI